MATELRHRTVLIVEEDDEVSDSLRRSMEAPKNATDAPRQDFHDPEAAATYDILKATTAMLRSDITDEEGGAGGVLRRGPYSSPGVVTGGRDAFWLNWSQRRRYEELRYRKEQTFFIVLVSLLFVWMGGTLVVIFGDYDPRLKASMAFGFMGIIAALFRHVTSNR